MASLYNRSTPSQRRVLRIIEGAVKNAADAHPEIQLSPRHTRSIAKRAAGTLTAQWSDVLAAKMPSVRAGETPGASTGAPAPQFLRGSGRGSRRLASPAPLLRFLWNRFSSEIALAKRDGRTERAETLIEVCRAIDALLSHGQSANSEK